MNSIYRSTNLSNDDNSLQSLLVAVVALVLSLSIHFGAYEAVRNRVVAFVRGIETNEPARSSDEDDPATRVELYQESEESGGTDLMKSSDPLAATHDLPEDLIASSTPVTIFDPPPRPAAQTLPAALPDPPKSEKADLPPPRELPAPDILAVTDARERTLAAPIERREIAAIERKLLSPDITQSYSVTETLPELDAAAAFSQLPRLLLASDSAASDPSRLLPAPRAAERAKAREAAVPDLGPIATGEVASTLMAEPTEEVAPATPLDDRLDIRTAAIRPASDPEHVYFQIDITPRDAAALPDIPRDIVFVQDTSNSLSFQRLPPCIKAIRTALRALAPTDRFNLCAFADTPTFLQPNAWLSPTPENLEAANAFLDALSSRGNTDLFQSMDAVLSLPRDPDRAQIVLLLTDGKANTGLSRDSAVIGAFSRLNNGAVSVFTVDVSTRGNEYLLDMLSFSNRGGNTETVSSRFDIEKVVGKAASSIGRPILTNVRFNFDAASAAEALPRLTSNLYRDRPLRLYGRLPADTPAFAFQARGDANGSPYDMLFEVNLADGSTAAAPASLPTDWATQRMYDLVSSYSRTEDPSILNEMQRLGAEFGIPIPHGRRLGVTD